MTYKYNIVYTIGQKLCKVVIQKQLVNSKSNFDNKMQVVHTKFI